MRSLRLIGLVAAAIGIGCGHSPSAPSPSTPSAASAPAAQAAVGTAVTQAINQVVLAAPLAGDVLHGLSYPCPEGGSIDTTFSAALPTGPGSTLTMTSKMEFNACKSQGIVIQGDPYLLTSGEYMIGPIVDNLPSSMTTTTRTTGGVRFTSAGTTGRAQYDCTQLMAIQFSSNGPPQISATSSGTITWEQPLGTVTTRPCGPERSSVN